MNYYLGIDNGGTTTKAALFDEQGRQAGAAEEFTQAVYPQPGFAERDMEEMWEANCRVIRRVIESTGIDPAQIRAAAVCGHGKGLYLWGQDNAPVRAGILSADNRAYSYPAAWRADGREKAVSAYTCQHIMACQPIPLLAWLRDHEPESLRHIKYIFSCKDYIRFRLTGGAYAERTDYSGSGLLNLYTGEYDARILEAFGLEKLSCALPPLKNAADLCGYVTEEAAKRTGLRAGTPVAGGMFDIDACALSAAVSGPNQVCMAAGTWSINECILPQPIAEIWPGISEIWRQRPMIFIGKSIGRLPLSPQRTPVRFFFRLLWPAMCIPTRRAPLWELLPITQGLIWCAASMRESHSPTAGIMKSSGAVWTGIPTVSG